MPTIILCDNDGQAERLDELLNEDTFSASPAALVIGVLDGGFVIPGRERGLGTGASAESVPGSPFPAPLARRAPRPHRPRDLPPRATAPARASLRHRRALEAITALKPGDFVVHLEHGVGIYRGIETIFVGESTVEVAVIEYEGGDRLNVPLYRIDQIERYRAAGDADGDAAAAAPAQARRQALGAAARAHARRDPGDDGRAARPLRAPAGRVAAAARSRHRRGSGSSSRRSCSRTRPTSARRRST